jgi:hypothetical protein
LYTRQPQRFSFGGFGSGPVPRDLIILLAVVFATFSMQFFETTYRVIEFLRLTPEVWRRGFLWQVVTYPFIGIGNPSAWIILELLILFWFGRDVYLGMRRRNFWRLVLTASVVAALAAVVVNILVTLVGGTGMEMFAFMIMQGQWMLSAIFVAAFATANRYATIYLFFVLPIQARWFLALEILFAFIAFLRTHDLAGFVGICTAVGVTYSYITYGAGQRGLREMWLRLQKRWISSKLERAKRKRGGMRVIPGDRDKPRRGPWVH